MLELSVVIPTHNRAELLGRVAAALLRQTLDPARYELVFADSASSDATPELLVRLTNSHENVRSCRAEDPGAARARNLGLELSRGPRVLLLDDDILVPPDFLARVLDAAQRHPKRVLLGKIVAPWQDTTDPFQRFLLQAEDVNSYRFPDPRNVPPNHFYTACVLLPREVLGTQRFDEKFTVYGLEDLDFGIRLLKDAGMVYLPELEVRHEYFPRWREYRRKKLATGCSLAYFFSKHPENARHFYIEPTGRRLAFRFFRLVFAPLAGVLYLLERARGGRGPVNGLLYAWFYRDLRVQLFNGMRRFNARRPPL